MAPSPWGEVLLEDERKDSIASGKTKVMRFYQLVTKYDGTTAFETFWVQFQNVVEYHQWTKRDQLFYLKSCLKDQAAQVLFSQVL